MTLNKRSTNNVRVEIVWEVVHVQRFTMLQHFSIPSKVASIYDAVVVQTKQLRRMQSTN
jgi:hypothetical protein